jgi:putative tryptophan/tyrosine transport system substrate-binding protein
MRRREAIAMLGSAVFAWPFVAQAQQQAKRLIGFLSPEPHRGAAANLSAAFLDRLSQLGYREHENFEMEARYADGNAQRLPALAEELIAVRPNVILAHNTSSAVALKHATSSIPIVAAFMIDPVGAGLIASEARPGGNVTGLLFAPPSLVGKQLELAMELVPGARDVGVLLNVNNPADLAQRRDLEKESGQKPVKLIFREVRLPEDIDPALRALSEQAQAIIVLADTMLTTAERRIAELAIERKLPTISGFREAVADGGLVSYGIDPAGNWRRAADYVDKILNGAKPGDLPIEFPTKLELVINLKTAAALGLTVPPDLLARADEVIE